ncbi:MAG: urease accessory protein UreE [Anabaena sp. CoA2_C59]|jgi:urease accessory protein|uniref:Urease accessory protein UreE n=1 Tax=Aphanizomenon flos-aquae FACHB-1249 TaxID=2692889 RepID=A0ABR8IQV4_APHFL|nr:MULTISPECIES: urease accessory protein UreE [Aphanizomenon]MCE2905821.1 urease accessory protein UreE [Anabaena sp. CoA2_C59]MDJ0503682.1 urease accessory protein UreE [Nostocales cyanobacterium LE14-WE12]MBD2390747.1 urease accessory protein UreE [Aphanizomenon flos-aquae FACHB-1171]MBD2556303.1 urease accessory protein UreE [Aphanizomenon flos-aquae FACHB-1290]MBD2631745.1 urease accessory protein UreE [Aphanizomenon sp. FACHB-1399]
MLTFTQLNPPNSDAKVSITLSLTAEERTRSRHKFILADGQEVFLRLSRGTVLNNGDILTDETQSIYMGIIAKSETVLTAYAEIPLLLRAAYHLGNRHVPVEITPTYLRLSPDPVLQAMLTQLGLEIQAEFVPFQPELGAYGNHSHS